MSENTMKQIPLQYQQPLQHLISEFVRTIANLKSNEYKNKATLRKYKNKLRDLGVSVHDVDPGVSESSSKRRLAAIRNTVNELDCVDGENLTSQFALEVIENDEEAQNVLWNEFYDEFVQIQSDIHKKESTDPKQILRNYISGFIHGWSESDFELINKLVSIFFVPFFVPYFVPFFLISIFYSIFCAIFCTIFCTIFF